MENGRQMFAFSESKDTLDMLLAQLRKKSGEAHDYWQRKVEEAGEDY